MRKIKILTLVLFFSLLGLGSRVASQRPLWNDEYYSQVASINNTPFADQFLGRISEGGNAPLFYCLQIRRREKFNYCTNGEN